MLGEEFVRDLFVGDFPRRRLGAVLAEFEGVRFFRLGPGTAYAHEAVRLVLAQQTFSAANRQFLLGKNTGHITCRSPPTRRTVVGFYLCFLSHRQSSREAGLAKQSIGQEVPLTTEPCAGLCV